MELFSYVTVSSGTCSYRNWLKSTAVWKDDILKHTDEFDDTISLMNIGLSPYIRDVTSQWRLGTAIDPCVHGQQNKMPLPHV